MNIEFNNFRPANQFDAKFQERRLAEEYIFHTTQMIFMIPGEKQEKYEMAEKVFTNLFDLFSAIFPGEMGDKDVFITHYVKEIKSAINQIESKIAARNN